MKKKLNEINDKKVFNNIYNDKKVLKGELVNSYNLSANTNYNDYDDDKDDKDDINVNYGDDPLSANYNDDDDDDDCDKKKISDDNYIKFLKDGYHSNINTSKCKVNNDNFPPIFKTYDSNPKKKNYNEILQKKNSKNSRKIFTERPKDNITNIESIDNIFKQDYSETAKKIDLFRLNIKKTKKLKSLTKRNKNPLKIQRENYLFDFQRNTGLSSKRNFKGLKSYEDRLKLIKSQVEKINFN